MYTLVKVVDEKKNNIEIPENYDIDDILYFLNDEVSDIYIGNLSFELEYLCYDHHDNTFEVDILCRKNGELIEDFTTSQLSRSEYCDLIDKIKEKLTSSNFSSYYFEYPKSLRDEIDPFKKYLLNEGISSNEDFELYDSRYTELEKEFESACDNCSGLYLVLEKEEIFDEE